MKSLEIVEKITGGLIIGFLNGRMNAESVPDFEEWADHLIELGAERIIIDLSSLTYISSAGLRAVLTVAKELQKRRGLIICGLYGIVAEVFHVSGFMEILHIKNTAAEALAEL